MTYPIAMSYWWLDVQMVMWDWFFWLFVAMGVFIAGSVVFAIWFGDRDDGR